MDTMVENSGHNGHRERMRQKFRNDTDLSSFTDLEVLEILLFSVIPRADTREIAQSLLNTFGNLHTVLSADIDSLCRVKGVGLKCAEHIVFLGQVFRRVKKESLISVQADDFDDLSRYLINFFKGDTVGRLCAFSINKSGRLTASTVLSVGITDRIAFDIEDLKTFLKQNNAEMLLLAHNCTDGTADPTEEDILLTRKIRNLLDDEVYLLDHVAVSTDNAVSMRSRGCFRSFE